jgi:2-hydroxymuconate-semialdehyde hydrolase
MAEEARTVDLPTGELAYLDQGEGPAVVLLHGFPTSSFLWRNVGPLLASRFRVITPDLMGYGRSAKPPEAPLHIRAQAGYVGELLERLDVDRVLAAIGHDIGGGVAQLLAFQGLADALVLIDAISLDSWPIEGVKMLQGTEPAQATEEFAANVVRLSLELGMSHGERLTDQAVESYTAPFREDPAALVRAVRGIDGEGLLGTEDDLARIGERLLVLWGEDDPYQPPEFAERLSDLVVGSTVAILPGCSHFLLEDAPETVGPLVYEWLRVRVMGEAQRHAHADTPVEASFERPEHADPYLP